MIVIIPPTDVRCKTTGPHRSPTLASRVAISLRPGGKPIARRRFYEASGGEHGHERLTIHSRFTRRAPSPAVRRIGNCLDSRGRFRRRHLPRSGVCSASRLTRCSASAAYEHATSCTIACPCSDSSPLALGQSRKVRAGRTPPEYGPALLE